MNYAQKFLSTALLFSALPAMAEVHLLGRSSLDSPGDRDTIRVTGHCQNRRDRDDDRIERIKVKVTRAAARLDSVRVFYGNGRSEELSLRQNFRANSESRWLDLRGRERCITSIRVIGSTLAPWILRGPLRVSAVVEVYGDDGDRVRDHRDDRDHRDHRDDHGPRDHRDR